MTITDDSLAATFEPMACRDCNAQGLTAEQCARILHAENMYRLAAANEVENDVDRVRLARAAKEADRLLAKMTGREDTVGIIDRLGFPLSVTSSHDKRFERALRSGRLHGVSPDVFQVL